jgi:GT2 family glycosyltransferase
MISVIVPAYNGEKTIGRCLSALMEQSKRPDEIIVVDDGSADKTADAIKKFKGVTLIKQDHNGPAAARNIGAKKARGELLLFTDMDCVPDREWVAEMIRPFEKREIAGVQGRYKTVQNGIVARFVQFEIEDRYDRMRKREGIDFIGSYSAGYRRDVFLKFGGFDDSFRMASGEDPEISFKLDAAGQKMVFAEKAVVYHDHVDSIGAYLRQKFWRAYWRVLLYKKHPNKIAGESYTPQMLKIQILLFGTLLASMVLTLFSVQYLTFFAVSTLLLFGSTLPLTFKNIRKSFIAGLITPFISVMRTMVFVLGLACGALKL